MILASVFIVASVFFAFLFLFRFCLRFPAQSYFRRILTVLCSSFCTAALFNAKALQSQTPPPINSTGASIVSLSVSSHIAERRAFSSPAAQPVFIIATRSNVNGAALVLLDIQYRTIDGQPLSNAELQSDWGTDLLSLVNMGTFTNFIFLDQGQSQGSIALYPTKVNFRRNPDRILSARLLPPRPTTGQQYVVNPSTTQNTVTITLRDNTTAPTQPFIINAIQNMAMTAGSVSLIEIETPTLRSDGIPSRVFANERGTPLFYSTTSFQPQIVRAEILTGDMRPNGHAALRLTSGDAGRATIILVAVDSANRAATASFETLVHQAPTAVSVRGSSERLAAESELELSPNPASNVVVVRGARSGAEIRLFSALGQELQRRRAAGGGEEERFWLEGLPAGAYFIVVERGDGKIIRTFVKK
jgi:hypothetical protein